MKSIQLTEKHKSKLLEMCKELFCEESEINSIQNFRVENDYILGLSDHILYCENRDLSENHYECEKVPEEDLVTFENYPIECFEINIHWYEFCILWLATIIYNKRKTNNFSILEYRGFLCQSVEHPIDFLYEEFKKLNYEYL